MEESHNGAVEESHNDAGGGERSPWWIAAVVTTPVEEEEQLSTSVEESSGGGGVVATHDVHAVEKWRNMFFFWLGLAGLSDENRSDFTLKNRRPGWNKYYWMAEISWLL